MRVRATTTGYYANNLYGEGDRFEIPDELFAKEWMVNLDAPPAAPQKPTLKRVMATAPGFYNNFKRAAGEVFMVPDQLFAKEWMTDLDAPATFQTQTLGNAA